MEQGTKQETRNNRCRGGSGALSPAFYGRCGVIPACPAGKGKNSAGCFTRELPIMPAAAGIIFKDARNVFRGKAPPRAASGVQQISQTKVAVSLTRMSSGVMSTAQRAASALIIRRLPTVYPVSETAEMSPKL